MHDCDEHKHSTKLDQAINIKFWKIKNSKSDGNAVKHFQFSVNPRSQNSILSDPTSLSLSFMSKTSAQKKWGLREAMERLLCSSSPALRFHLKPTPFLPSLPRFHSPKLGLPSLSRPDFRRLNLVSCNHENPSTPSIELPALSLPLVHSPTGSTLKSHFPQQVANGSPVQQKVWIFSQLFGQ